MCLEFCLRLFSPAYPAPALFGDRVIPGQGRGYFDIPIGIGPRRLFQAPVVINSRLEQNRFSRRPVGHPMAPRLPAREMAVNPDNLGNRRVAVGSRQIRF